MSNATNRQAACSIALLFTLSLALACDSTQDPSGVTLLPGVALAKAPTGVTVAAANPSFGEQGQTNEAVTITGTGFDATSQASWLRNGVVDTSITVKSTTFVNSTTLIATIDISSKSPVDYRDIKVVTYGRTQGIGSLLFEVTQAIEIPGTSWTRSINDNGEATGTLSGGNGVFYYNIATGILETLSSTGTGYDISPDGTAIVGSGGPTGASAYLYTRTGPGGTWQGTALPVGTTTTSAVARAMRVDGTGQVVQIGGVEFGGPGAVTWNRQADGTWQRAVLPGSDTEVRHRAISANGILGGTASGGKRLGPAVWMPNGSGGYALTTLAASGAVNGVRYDGGLLVGFTTVPVYWLAQPGGGWSAPITVAGGCSGVKDVSDAGRFVLNSCPIGNGKQASAAYADPPYAALSRLGGLGPTGVPASVAGISRGGRYAAGYAGSVGVYWSLP